METDSIDFAKAWAIIRRRGLLILFCTAVVAGAAFFVSSGEPDEYTASSSLVFNQDPLASQITGLVPETSGALLAQQQSNVELVERGSTAATTARRLGQGLSEDDVNGAVEVSGNPESNIVSVSATSTSPQLAAAIATTYAKQFVNQRRGENEAFFSSALKLINSEIQHMPLAARYGPAAAALQNRAQNLRLLRGVGFSDVRVAQKATVPASPSGPEVEKNAVIGGLIGLLIGIGIAFLLERRARERYVREPEELAKLYGQPLLGGVPENRVLADAGGTATLPPGQGEALSLLRAHLRLATRDRAPGAILLTGPARGEGVSTAALCLAEATARMGSRVLLLELDLRGGGLAQRLGLEQEPTLVDVLTENVSLPEAVASIELGSGGASAIRSFDVLGAAPAEHPTELVEGDAMQRLLDYARSAYDLVVVDAPPLTAAPEVYPLLNRVDGVIVVNRAGRSRRDLSLRLRDALEGAGATLIGVVASRVDARDLDAYAGAPARASTPVGAVGVELGNGVSPRTEPAPELGT